MRAALVEKEVAPPGEVPTAIGRVAWGAAGAPAVVRAVIANEIDARARTVAREFAEGVLAATEAQAGHRTAELNAETRNRTDI